MNRAALLFIVLAAAALPACSEGDDASSSQQAQSQAAARPAEVGVITLHPQQVPFTATVPGRTVASAVSEIRPQVNGIIQKRLFDEGRQIEAGSVLYEIDDRPYRAAVDSAQANVEKTEAALARAQADFKRAEELRQRNVTSQQALDEARATLLQAEADLAGAKAALQSAQIDLSNTKVTAPISGLIGRSQVTEGALVTANQSTALTTIRQIDPMYVDMTESSARLLQVRRMLEQRPDPSKRPTAKIHLTLEDGEEYAQVGTVEAAEGSVSETTGTVTIRAVIDNPARLLLPGMYVRATVEVNVQREGFLVPQRAVSRNAKGEAIAIFVTPDGKAEMRVLETEQSYTNAWLVLDGIKDGDRLIVDGLQRVRSGQPVKPVAMEVDEQGLVRPAAAAASSQ
ncbi:efflux RND transporter periplasmic adaptor subunit [Rhodoligotrophos ferricapiens]|uniref:efflux RND transporter periplasmic adaptor subunit n=1 Tax=Rhodoligotrophos ferricapiens TaxID=3069264 RepID=UPI00315D9AF2